MILIAVDIFFHSKNLKPFSPLQASWNISRVHPVKSLDNAGSILTIKFFSLQFAPCLIFIDHIPNTKGVWRSWQRVCLACIRSPVRFRQCPSTFNPVQFRSISFCPFLLAYFVSLFHFIILCHCQN